MALGCRYHQKILQDFSLYKFPKSNYYDFLKLTIVYQLVLHPFIQIKSSKILLSCMGFNLIYLFDGCKIILQYATFRGCPLIKYCLVNYFSYRFNLLESNVVSRFILYKNRQKCNQEINFVFPSVKSTFNTQT